MKRQKDSLVIWWRIAGGISFLLLMFFESFAQSKSEALNQKIRQEVQAIENEFKQVYIDLHQNPELSLMEKQTSDKMGSALQKLGFEVKRIGGYGLAGIYKNGDGPVIMYRTDMDALPVEENTGLPFASTKIGPDAEGEEYHIMHACGHDMHMTVWLGTLTTLVKLRDQWKGTLLAVAQPAEEIGAGARNMIEDGLFAKCPVPDEALCFHVSAEIQAGQIGYLPGVICAGVGSADITIYGIGGHGAKPDKTIDPIVLAARTILGIQTIVSRNISPVEPAVITVGSIHGGTKNNIIPDEVQMQLTIRFF